jgi:hypothetical protein
VKFVPLTLIVFTLCAALKLVSLSHNVTRTEYNYLSHAAFAFRLIQLTRADLGIAMLNVAHYAMTAERCIIMGRHSQPQPARQRL